RWERVYRGHRIRFENSWYTGEALFIDGVLVDRCGTGPRRQLSSMIEAGDGAGDVIVALPETRFLTVGCHIMAERQAGPLTGARRIEEDRRRAALRSPWLRLGWIGAVYVLLLIPLLSSLGYSDAGAWSTPWIEWIAAPIIALWALRQFARQTRPRWLPVFPTMVAL